MCGAPVLPLPTSRQPKVVIVSILRSRITGRAPPARACHAEPITFYYFCRPAEEQAQWFIQNVPRDPSALPHVWTWNGTTGLRLHASPRRVHGSSRNGPVSRHPDRVLRPAPGGLHAPDFYRETGIGALPGTEFWLRSVAGHPSKVYPGQRWTSWQYTGTGLVPGVGGLVDINVFSGSVADWTRWRR